MSKISKAPVYTDDLINYLNENIAQVNYRVQRLLQITSIGGFLSDDEIANLKECNDVSKTSSEILNTFDRTNWNRSATREILIDKLDSVLNDQSISPAAIKVYYKVILGLSD